MLRDIPLRYFLALALFLSGILPLAAISLVSYSIMKEQMKDQAFAQLESVRDIKKSMLADHFGKQAGNYDIAYIDLLMNERSAMGETGETYLVGPDLRMRSDSYLAPQRHSVAASRAGTVADNGADTIAVRRALAGETGRDIIDDYRRRRVLSAYTPVRVDDGTTFALLAEIDEKEIDDRIAGALNDRIVIILFSALLLIVFSAALISILISRNIRQVIGELGNLLKSVLIGKLSHRAVPERVGTDFREVVRHMNEVVDAYSRNSEEKLKLEQAMEYNQRLEAIGTLAGGIAHDFNNILTYMYSYAELVRAGTADDPTVRRHLDELIKGMDRAAALIGQIMTFSRQKANEKTALDISLIVKETVKMLSEVLPRNIRVESAVEPEVYLLADPVHLHQILMNLATNAFHAMQKDGGVLTIALKRVGSGTEERARLTVADTGAGMSAEVQSRMFEPFFTTKPPGQGSGMGLAVVHGAVCDLGGRIKVDSAPGRGTTITVLLPTISEEQLAEEPAPDSEPPRGTGRLCLIDDEPEIVRSVTELLTGFGYTVEGFTDPAAAYASWSQEPERFDLVLTDFNMPGMNGAFVATRMKERRPSQKILLITGYNDLVSPDDAARIGFAEILTKPFSAIQLASIVARTLRAG